MTLPERGSVDDVNTLPEWQSINNVDSTVRLLIEVFFRIRRHKPQALNEGQTADENKESDNNKGRVSIHITPTPTEVNANNNDDQTD